MHLIVAGESGLMYKRHAVYTVQLYLLFLWWRPTTGVNGNPASIWVFDKYLGLMYLDFSPLPVSTIHASSDFFQRVRHI